MSITTPAAIQVSTPGQLLVPSMLAQPLQRALENLNYLWKWHRPPLVDVCPNVTHLIDRHVMVYPVTPSFDSLRYTFEHRLLTVSATTVGITVDYCTAYAGGSTSWTNIYTATAGTTTAGVLWAQVDHNHVIPHDAVALRVSYLTGSGNYLPHHLLVYPTPDVASAGITQSGFTPFDDGLLVGTTGAAVHTEFLNRCKRSALTLLKDRRQQVLSFLQVETGTTLTLPNALTVNDDWQDSPTARLFFPHQSGAVEIWVSVLADVATGTNTDLVRVRQLGGTPNPMAVTFNADGAINTLPLTLTLQDPGGLHAYADVAVGIKSVAANRTQLRAVSACWRPGD